MLLHQNQENKNERCPNKKQNNTYFLLPFIL